MESKGLKIYECVAGSHAYGTNTPQSDVDIRGIFMLPREELISLSYPVQQVSDETNDITYFELRRYFELALKANPNILELLWMPPDCIRFCDPAMTMLFQQREIFLSKVAMESFSGYAYAQIKRAKGQNKWVNNPQPEEPPDKLDFCWLIHLFSPALEYCWDCDYPEDIEDPEIGFPVRPIPIRNNPYRIKLDECHVAKLEHCENIYRLYCYGEEAKGVFRGPNQQLVVESIPKRDEFEKLRGLLIFNEQAYDAAKRDHKNYWEWVEKRNKARWITQESGEIDYDAKNMMHCMRLMLSGMSILEHGAPIVRFEGEQRELLMNIRNGKFEYPCLMAMMEEYEARLKDLGKKSQLPDKASYKKAERLYQQIVEEYR
jgi:predicted nucleotidyltransferase